MDISIITSYRKIHIWCGLYNSSNICLLFFDNFTFICNLTKWSDGLGPKTFPYFADFGSAVINIATSGLIFTMIVSQFRRFNWDWNFYSHSCKIPFQICVVVICPKNLRSLYSCHIADTSVSSAVSESVSVSWSHP